jgi:radical SAM protein with 4Fe4S-binding SPASM domain
MDNKMNEDISKKFKLSNYGFDVLQIESTAACNMACSFCPYPLKDDKISKLELNDIFNVLDSIDFNDKNFKYVTFSQFNEPLLDKRIFEILKYCNQKKIPVLFITNGLLLNKEKNVENLIKYATNIKISLQVLDANKHKDARGLNLELERYVKSIIEFCKKVKDMNHIKINIDLGCNFNEKKFNYYLKKILGIQVGDPSVPKDLKSSTLMFSKFLNYFYDISDTKYQDSLNQLRDPKKFFSRNYLNQDGYKIFENITLKLKPFFYGRRISEFHAINDNFSCNSSILGILADGNVVPCCLAYDESISMGKVNKSSLKQILTDGSYFLDNLRTKKANKHETCKKCFGEPTKRGAIARNIWNALPPRIQKTFNFLRLTEY